MLQEFIDQRVTVMTIDNKILTGLLKGTDQTTNIILAETVELPDTPLGLHLVRGDSLLFIGN